MASEVLHVDITSRGVDKVNKELDSLNDMLQDTRTNSERATASVRGFSGASAGSVGGVNTLTSAVSALSSALISVGAYQFSKNFVSGTLEATVSMDSLNKMLTSVMGSAEVANREFAKLKNLARTTVGIDTQGAIKAFAAFTRMGDSASVAEKKVKDLSNAVAFSGGGAEEINRAIIQIEQLSSKTSGFSQDLRSIAESIPGVGQKIREAFGAESYEALSEMGVTGKQVAKVLMEELGKLPKVQAGVNEAFKGLNMSIFEIKSQLGETFVPVLNLVAGAFKGLAEAMEVTPKWVKYLVAYGVAGAGAFVVIKNIVDGYKNFKEILNTVTTATTKSTTATEINTKAEAGNTLAKQSNVNATGFQEMATFALISSLNTLNSSIITLNTTLRDLTARATAYNAMVNTNSNSTTYWTGKLVALNTQLATTRQLMGSIRALPPIQVQTALPAGTGATLPNAGAGASTGAAANATAGALGKLGGAAKTLWAGLSSLTGVVSLAMVAISLWQSALAKVEKAYQDHLSALLDTTSVEAAAISRYKSRDEDTGAYEFSEADLYSEVNDLVEQNAKAIDNWKKAKEEWDKSAFKNQDAWDKMAEAAQEGANAQAKAKVIQEELTRRAEEYATALANARKETEAIYDNTAMTYELQGMMTGDTKGGDYMASATRAEGSYHKEMAELDELEKKGEDVTERRKAVETKYQLEMAKANKSYWDEYNDEQKKATEEFDKAQKKQADLFKNALNQYKSSLKEAISKREAYTKSVIDEARKQRDAELGIFSQGQLAMQASLVTDPEAKAKLQASTRDNFTQAEILNASSVVSQNKANEEAQTRFAEQTLFGNELDNARGQENYMDNMEKQFQLIEANGQQALQWYQGIFNQLALLNYKAETS